MHFWLLLTEKMKFFVKKRNRKVAGKGKDNMKKILIICFVTVISIIVGDIFLQRFVDSTFDQMSSNLEKMDGYVDNAEECKRQLDELDASWEKNFLKMACYLEHDELEKVKTQIVVIRAGIEADDKMFVHEEINRAIYIIQHIKEKESFRLDNIM